MTQVRPAPSNERAGSMPTQPSSSSFGSEIPHPRECPDRARMLASPAHLLLKDRCLAGHPEPSKVQTPVHQTAPGLGEIAAGPRTHAVHLALLAAGHGLDGRVQRFPAAQRRPSSRSVRLKLALSAWEVCVAGHPPADWLTCGSADTLPVRDRGCPLRLLSSGTQRARTFRSVVVGTSSRTVHHGP